MAAVMCLTVAKAQQGAQASDKAVQRITKEVRTSC